MKTIQVCHYDAFSNVPNKGNPAGVVLDGENLNEEQMREVAEKVGFNETAFQCGRTYACAPFFIPFLRHG